MIDSLPLLSPTTGSMVASVPGGLAATLATTLPASDGDALVGVRLGTSIPSFGATLGQFLDARDTAVADRAPVPSLPREGQESAADGKDLPGAPADDDAPAIPLAMPSWFRDAVPPTPATARPLTQSTQPDTGSDATAAMASLAATQPQVEALAKSGNGAAAPDDTLPPDADPIATPEQPISRRRAAGRALPTDPQLDPAVTPPTGASATSKAGTPHPLGRRAALKETALTAATPPIAMPNVPAPVSDDDTHPTDTGAAADSLAVSTGPAAGNDAAGIAVATSISPVAPVPVPDPALAPNSATTPVVAPDPSLPAPIAVDIARAQLVSQPAAPLTVPDASVDIPATATATHRTSDSIVRTAAQIPGAAPVADPRPDPATTVSTIPQPAGQMFAAAIATAWRDRSRPAARDLADGAAMLATAPVGAREQAIVHATADAQGTPLDLGKDTGLQRMVDHIESLRDNADAGDTRVRLAPDALGSVDIAVRQEGDRVHVRFTAEQDATRALIADAQPRLTELAAARGVRIGETSVSVGGGNAQTASGNGATPQPRPAPQAPRAPRSVATDTTVISDQRLA